MGSETDWLAVWVEGALGGAVVLLGLLVAAVLERSRTRRRAVEIAYQQLVHLLPAVVAGFTAHNSDLSDASTWRARYEDLQNRLAEIRVHARQFWGARRVYRAANETYAMLLIADEITEDGRRIDGHAFMGRLPVGEMRDALFGRFRTWLRGRGDGPTEREEQWERCRGELEALITETPEAAAP